jgi:hypothetical protein
VTSNTSSRSPITAAHDLYRDTRGTVMVEYVILIGTMAIGGALGLVVIGLAFVESFVFVRGLLLSGVP